MQKPIREIHMINVPISIGFLRPNLLMIKTPAIDAINLNAFKKIGKAY